MPVFEHEFVKWAAPRCTSRVTPAAIQEVVEQLVGDRRLSRDYLADALGGRGAYVLRDDYPDASALESMCTFEQPVLV